jgi:hypothetical protein
MSDSDEDVLKAEIDEIMRRVDAIMDKVARVIPETPPPDAGEGSPPNDM